MHKTAAPPDHLAIAPAPDEPTDRRGVRPRELARQLGVAPNVVYTAIYTGELDVWRFGRAMVIPVAAVESWLASKAA